MKQLLIKLYGADWCPDCLRVKSFLSKNNMQFEFIDVDINKEATNLVEQINHGKRIIPTLIINEKTYSNPDNSELAIVLGINKAGNILFFGADWCPDCRRAKSYLQDNHINFRFIDIDNNEEAIELVEKINKGKRIIPTILINEKPYTNPDNAILKRVLNLQSESKSKVYDTIIVGAGAAGLTTSIYVQRDRLDSLILEKKNIGGNTFLTEKIENYPGFQNISGPKLMTRMAEQAQVYGAEIETGVEVLDYKKKDNVFEIETNMGAYYGKSIVLSLGSTYRKLGISGEDDLIGSGIHFCATCDGAFYRDREVIVLGGGNSALEEGIFLSKFCKKVKIIHRAEQFTASQTYVEKIKGISNIEVLLNKTAMAFIANEKDLFQGVQIKDNKSEKTNLVTADGAFIFIGLIPNTQNFKKKVQMDDKGLIITNGFAKTSQSGVFAAGDCRKGAIAQVAAATGEGVLASYGIKNYLK